MFPNTRFQQIDPGSARYSPYNPNNWLLLILPSTGGMGALNLRRQHDHHHTFSGARQWRAVEGKRVSTTGRFRWYFWR